MKKELSPDEKRRRNELLIIGVISVLIVILTAVEMKIPQVGGMIPIANNIIVFSLININIILILLLIFLVIRNLVKLLFERKRKVMGAKLRTKLVVAFVSLSLVPTALLFFVAAGFITNTTEAPEATTPEAKAEQPEAKPEIHIPKARFDEMSKRAQAFERFGTPEQVAQAFNALAYYQEIERQAVEEASKSKTGEPTDETAKRLADARDVLYNEVDPELKQSKEQAKTAHAYTQAQQDRCRRIATRETRAILKEAGQDDSPASVTRMGKQLSVYFDDEELNDEFWFNPRAAVRQAHKAWREDVTKGTPKEKEAEPKPETRLPRGPTPTGGSPHAGKTGADTAAMSEKDFEAHIKAKMRSGLGH